MQLTNLQNALTLDVPPTPQPPAPGYRGPTATLKETVQGGPLTVVNGTQGGPGVWRYMPVNGQETWTNLTDIISNIPRHHAQPSPTSSSRT